MHRSAGTVGTRIPSQPGSQALRREMQIARKRARHVNSNKKERERKKINKIFRGSRGRTLDEDNVNFAASEGAKDRDWQMHMITLVYLNLFAIQIVQKRARAS